MRRGGALAVALWFVAIALGAAVALRARYVTDLSAFLPENPTDVQRLLVDQLRDGPASRLILIGIEGADTALRAQLSAALARRLRQDRQFTVVNNGDGVAAARDAAFIFRHRYLLSEQVSASRFSAAGLKSAIGETIDALSSPAGPWFKSLILSDPTGEMLQVLDQWERVQSPRTQGAVWVSGDAGRALLAAETRAAGSDTDGQQRALEAIDRAFAAAVLELHTDAVAPRLKATGPGVFAVAARAKIERAALRLALAGGGLVIGLLWLVYRSLAALALGLLPVASGALAGIAAVALVFGAVHGITLAFGMTLIGESVDYSIYYFIPSRTGHSGDGERPDWQRAFWPTVRLGMLTSVCGFASLLPSGFPGLAQLGLYSIAGLIAAALVTRFILPPLTPRDLAIRDLAPLGRAIAGLLTRRATPLRAAVGAALACSVLVLGLHSGRLWNRELSALSPISLEDQRFDAAMRADLGAAGVRDLVVVPGRDLQAVLEGAEHAGGVLDRLAGTKLIGGFDSPANFLPSVATQEARRRSLPNDATLRANLELATATLPLRSAQLTPFLSDVAAARAAPPLTPQDLDGTSFAAGFAALVLHPNGRWVALLPLHAPQGAAGEIDAARVRNALEEADPGNAVVLDLKSESDALYASYLTQAIHLSLGGFAGIALLLLLVLKSVQRVAQILTPLALAVVAVAAMLALCGQQLNLLHLVGMLLIVAVGSNYALFFDRRRMKNAEAGGASSRETPLTLASLALANAATVVGFGMLSFCAVPILVALGTTVAPGAFLALAFAAVLSGRTAPRDLARGVGS